MKRDIKAFNAAIKAYDNVETDWFDIFCIVFMIGVETLKGNKQLLISVHVFKNSH